MMLRWLPLLAGCVLSVGCDSAAPLSGSAEDKSARPQTDGRLDEYIETAKLRQRLAEAKTRGDVVRAQEALVAQLKKRYGGIDASLHGPDAVPHYIRFSRLMREWNPLHFSADDLKAIAGTPTKETLERIKYRFDKGDVASVWRFNLQGGMIRGVEYIPGD